MRRRVVSSCAAALVAAGVVGRQCRLRIAAAQARHGEGRGDARGRHAATAGAADRGLLPRHGLTRRSDRPAFTQAEIEGRNMWIVWTGGNDRLLGRALRRQPRHLRLPEDHLVASRRSAYGSVRRTTAGSTRAGQRAVLQEGDRARSEPLRPVARRPRSGLPARSVRRRDEVSGRADRRARQDRAGRLLLRRADRHRRPAAVSRTRTSTRRRARTGTRSATTAIPTYYYRPRPGAAVPRRHVVRASATSGRTRSSRRPIRRTRSGRT